MTLAALSDTSGNYIGEIEMGRRIPSFEKIEKIASALRIDVYQLFIEETDEHSPEKKPTAKDFLLDLPRNIRDESISHLLSVIHKGILESFEGKNY
jgi:transcriptional regulator with XRE-family HTH domain